MRGLRWGKQARHELVPGRRREILAARAVAEIDEIALVAIEPDAREEPRRRYALPHRARDAQIDQRELELGVVVGAKR